MRGFCMFYTKIHLIHILLSTPSSKYCIIGRLALVEFLNPLNKNNLRASILHILMHRKPINEKLIKVST